MKEACPILIYIHNFIFTHIMRAIYHSTRGESKSVDLNEIGLINFIQWQSAMFQAILQYKFFLSYTQL